MFIKSLGEASCDGDVVLLQIVSKTHHVRLTAQFSNDLKVAAHSSNVGATVSIARAFGGGLELIALDRHNILHLCGQFDLEVVD